MTIEKKACSRCKNTKLIKEFGKNKSRKDGYQNECKTCRSKIAKFYFQKYKEKRNTYNLRKKYGISPQEYAQLLDKQQSECAICRTTKVNNKSGRFNIDHDHVTGKVRGLLCSECNTGLGKLGDSIESLEKALEYLKNHVIVK